MDNEEIETLIDKYRKIAAQTGGVVVALETAQGENQQLCEVGVVTQENAAKIRELMQQ